MLMEKYADNDDDFKISFINSSGVKTDILYRYCKVTMFTKNDLALLTVDRRQGLKQFPNIIKHFMPLDLLPKDLPRLSSVLAYTTHEGIRTTTEYIPVSCRLGPFTYTAIDKTWNNSGWIYDIHGVPASCMSPLWLADTEFHENYIMGLHSAGTKKNSTPTGVSVVTTQEQIHQMFELHDVPSSGLVIELETVAGDGCCNSIPSKFPIIGLMKRGLSQSCTNKLKKTPFFECFGPNEKIPTILSPYSVTHDDGRIVEHDPTYNALTKYCFDNFAINPELLTMACSMFTHRWDSCRSEFDRPLKTWNVEDAIHGKGFVGPDSRTTSVGVELGLRGLTKKKMYGKEGLRDLTVEPIKGLIVEVKEMFKELEQGIVQRWTNKGFLKAEVISAQKVWDGKGRYISGADWKQLMAEKCYFGDLQSDAVRHNIANGFAMGVNPYSYDWTSVYNMFKVFCHVFDGDFSKFDGHIKQFLFYMFSQFCRHVYHGEPEPKHIARETILHRLCNSLHAIQVLKSSIDFDKLSEEEKKRYMDYGDSDYVWVIVLWYDSITSGCFITQLLGSFCDNVLQRYNYLMSWVKSLGLKHLTYSAKLHEKPDLVRLENNIYVIVLSDDHIVGIKDKLFPFGARDVQNNFAEIGFLYTDARKTGVIDYDYKEILDCIFLQRTFILDNEPGSDKQRALAPLEDPSIIHMFYWSEEGLKHFPQIVDTGLQEMSLKSRERFRHFVSQLQNRASDIRYKLSSMYMDYDLARSFCLNTTYAPWGEVLSESNL